MILLLFSGNNFLPRNLISTDFHILLFNFIFHNGIKPVYAKYDLQQEILGFNCMHFAIQKCILMIAL